MPITVVFRVALRALRRNVLRTVLTMLGIIIGVAAVMAMVALGNGAQGAVESEMRSAGANLVFVTAGNYTRGGDAVNIASGLGAATTLTPADADAIAAVEGVAYRAAGVSERAFAAAGERRAFGRIQGTDVQFPSLYDWHFEAGQFFTSANVSSAAHVAVLGRTVAERLFDNPSRALGQIVEIKGQRFTVVGVTASTTADQAETVFVPYTALQRMLAISHVHTIVVGTREAGDASAAAETITRLLRARHGLEGSGRPDDFTVRTQAGEAITKGLYTSVAAFALANMPNLDKVTLDEMQGALSRANSTMTALLAGIATVSLIVGGIGIMNIMLVAVTERTREIGLRRAVGARSRDVLVQFLVEAVTLSMVGGLVGIAVGFLASSGIERLLEWPTRVSPGSVGLSFAIAVAVGVFFGFYPARKASRLDPIDALRYE
jgi:ABC-type antimicrobial peptide transport system permease subunit